MMNKKILFSVVAIILAVITITVGTLLIIKNIGDCRISIKDKTALAGDTISIPIIIEKNSGLWGGQVIINYDPKNLSLVSATNGEIFDECQYNDTGDSIVLLFNQIDLKDSKKDGVVATLNVKVKATTAADSTTLTFDEESNFCNAKESIVEPVLEDGTITIK